MRTVMTMNLSYVECVDMMAYWGERRKLWDSSFKGMDLPFGDDFLLDDDCRVTERIDHGTLLHMAGVPRSLDLKFYRRWDHPAKGQVTTALVPWNHKKDCLDPDNSILTVKCSTIMPHPADPSKTIITTLEVSTPLPFHWQFHPFGMPPRFRDPPNAKVDATHVASKQPHATPPGPRLSLLFDQSNRPIFFTPSTVQPLMVA
jgi:hypothetical protein